MEFQIVITRNAAGHIDIKAPVHLPDICMQMLGACLVALGQNAAGHLIVPKQPASVEKR